MAVFTTHQFVIDKSNTNYIKALEKHGKYIWVEEVNYKNVSDKNYTCADIEKIMATVRGDGFGIKCRSANSRSSVGAFPALNGDMLYTTISSDLSIEDNNQARKNAEKISEYFSHISGLHGAEVYVPTPKDITTMSKDQALFCLDLLQKQHEVTGAMFFEDLNQILLQVRGDNFIIEFGANTRFFKCPMLVFDLDDGFLPRDEGEELEIFNRLQDRFLAWKNNDYAGDLIPADTSGFKYKQNFAASSYVKFGQFAHDNSQNPTSSAEETKRFII